MKIQVFWENGGSRLRRTVRTYCQAPSNCPYLLPGSVELSVPIARLRLTVRTYCQAPSNSPYLLPGSVELSVPIARLRRTVRTYCQALSNCPYLLPDSVELSVPIASRFGVKSQQTWIFERKNTKSFRGRFIILKQIGYVRPQGFKINKIGKLRIKQHCGEHTWFTTDIQGSRLPFQTKRVLCWQ